ncbi:heparin-binding EGF-like growth factor a [Polymixia lowei]
MRILRVALLLVHAFVVSRLVSGAAVDRFDSEKQQQTAVINLLDTRNDRTTEEAGVDRPAFDYGEEDDDEEYEYYEDEEEDGMSGDYEVELPRVSMSSKPKDPSAILNTERVELKRRRGKGNKKGKGKGKKRNPCLKKYKTFCIHGTCQYLRDIRAPSCVCLPNYSGERCQFFILPVEGKTQEGYSRTTALAVVAVVLSSVCLTIIGLLLALRFHKRGAYDVENEEKVKLGLAPNH